MQGMSSGQGEYFNKIISLFSAFPAASKDKLSEAGLLIRTKQAKNPPPQTSSLCCDFCFVVLNGEMTEVEQVSLGFLKTASC